MDLKLAQKVVVVTGGALGIGAGISEVLAEEGATVVVASRSSTAAGEFMARLSLKTRAHFIEADLGPTATAERVIAETIAKFGRIDAIVNNAGVNDGVALDGDPAKFRLSLERNIIQVFDLAHFALPHLKKSVGNIVNIGSKVADAGQGGTSGYAASKGAMNALTREWAVELAPHGIRVNTVIPAEVMTPQYERWAKTLPDPDKALSKIANLVPLGRRMTTSREIGLMTVFVVSSAASHITGQIIYVDGGYTHLDRKCTA
jgi:NAD(P)-dependent dehydrogenase (short-subunit alcohol dehydrogenase family)